MPFCTRCKETKADADFTLTGARTKWCRACTKQYMGERRGVYDPCQRMLFNLKNRNMPEAVLWTYDDVKRLFDKVELLPEVQQAVDEGKIQLKYRIVRVDPTRPLLPDNGVVRISRGI